LLFGTIGLIGLVLLRQWTVLVENVNFYNEMHRLATTDALTSIYNRHFFNETFRREVERARRYGKPMAILLLDVDNFKMFNDRLGHLHGDEVLKAVAHVLSKQLRKSDILARFGGDEFVMIMPETDQASAKNAVERIQSAVANHSYAHIPLGVSAGISGFRPGLTPEQMLEEADRGLYQHKSSKAAQSKPDHRAYNSDLNAKEDVP
jgi:diguanylate cyclase (GGDEF)-like protein